MAKPTENIAEWTVLVGRVKGRWDHSNLRIQSFSDVKEYFANGGKLCIAPATGERKLLTIREARFKDNGWICDLGLLTSESADELKGAQVFVHPSQRPALPEGEFYLDDLFGMRVVTEGGKDLGEINEVLETPAHNVYVTKKTMVPAHPDFIVNTDWTQRVLTVKDILAEAAEE